MQPIFRLTMPVESNNSESRSYEIENAGLTAFNIMPISTSYHCSMTIESSPVWLEGMKEILAISPADNVLPIDFIIRYNDITGLQQAQCFVLEDGRIRRLFSKEKEMNEIDSEINRQIDEINDPTHLNVGSLQKAVQRQRIVTPAADVKL